MGKLIQKELCKLKFDHDINWYMRKLEVDFTVPTDNKLKIKKSEKIDKYLDQARELKKNKLCNMNMMLIQIVIGALGTIATAGKKDWKKNGNQWLNRDHPDYSSAEIGQNTKKIRGDMKRLVVTQPLVK